MEHKPSIFIGSSTEGLSVAEALQEALDQVADVELWTQGIFNLSQSYLESLIKELDSADFAVLVMTPDDVVISREQQGSAPRDNILFELGLFMGRLGRERCFFVFDRTQDLKLPTDLLGIAAATYRPNDRGNMLAALGAASTAIKRSIASLGCRPVLLRFTPAETLPNTGVPDVSGTWAGYSPDAPDPTKRNSTLYVKQYGSFIRATVEREVRKGTRTFEYEGRFTSGQLILFFEEDRGRGFIVGTVVLYLSGDLRTLTGKSTYYNHTKKEVVSTERIFRRI